MLDRYTVEQIDVLVRSVWQHRITTLKVIAYAIGGTDSRERVPDGGQRDRPAAQPEPDGAPTWSEARGRMNLARRRADGSIEVLRPWWSPTEDQRRKELAVAQLLGVQTQVAESQGKVAPRRRAAAADPQDVAAAVDRMNAQLAGAPKPRGRRR